MKTKNVFLVLVVAVLVIFAIMAFFADKISIGVTHY